MATLATTDKLIAEQPERIAGAVRAISATQLALQNEVQLAEDVAAKLFPEIHRISWSLYGAICHSTDPILPTRSLKA